MMFLIMIIGIIIFVQVTIMAISRSSSGNTIVSVIFVNIYTLSVKFVILKLIAVVPIMV